MECYRAIDTQEPSRQAIQDHIAAGRCEVTTVGYAESQFTSGLQPVVSARTVPKAVTRVRRKQSLKLCPRVLA